MSEMKTERVTASAFKPGTAGARLRSGDLDAIIVTGAKGKQVPRAALTVLPPPAGKLMRTWAASDGGIFEDEEDAREWLRWEPDAKVYQAILVPVREVEP